MQHTHIAALLFRKPIFSSGRPSQSLRFRPLAYLATTISKANYPRPTTRPFSFHSARHHQLSSPPLLERASIPSVSRRVSEAYFAENGLVRRTCGISHLPAAVGVQIQLQGPTSTTRPIPVLARIVTQRLLIYNTRNRVLRLLAEVEHSWHRTRLTKRWPLVSDKPNFKFRSKRCLIT